MKKVVNGTSHLEIGHYVHPSNNLLSGVEKKKKALTLKTC